MNIALPAAQAGLDMSDSARQWVITIYALTFGGLMLLGGRLADVLGLRRSLVIGLIGFAAASILGGIAPNGAGLLAGRALQGAAGALVAAAALALLSITFDRGPERSRAFAILGTVMGLSGGGAFILGGALTDVLSWRWCLLINAPIALVAALGVSRTATETSATTRPRLDLGGALLVTAAIGGLVLGFDRANVNGWGAAPTLVSLAVGVTLLGVFVATQQRTATPLLPLHLVTDRTRGSAYLAVFVLGLGLFAGFFFLTFYLQDVRGYSPLRTGFAFLPFGVAAMTASRFVAQALLRTSTATLLSGGLLSLAAGIGYLTQLKATSSYAVGVLPTFVLLGIGATTVMVTASNAATLGAGRHSGVAGAAVGASQQIGAALGTALLSSIASTATASYLRDHTGGDVALQADVYGFNRASAVGALMLAIAALAVGLLSLRRSPSKADAIA